MPVTPVNSALLFLMLISLKVASQNIPVSPPPGVIRSIKVYKGLVKNNPAAGMTDVKKSMPGLMLDLRYATKNNFMHQNLYPALTTTYLRRAAVQALDSVEKELRTVGLGLKIFDAYRPYSVTRKMWELIGDERYVANPAKGSGHNRGTTVDLTLVQLATGQELDMGTGFDNFSDTAHHTFTHLPEEVLHNRKLLRTTMERHGFVALETEWWHYSLAGSGNYDLLDISFKKLKKLVSQN
ncbi:MAG: M15 family metallopeptidase [Williamsia sp.]|nr:M15 family metallopeptidase [Williamsia sp.]